MADSLHPFDDEKLRDPQAPARARDDNLSADELLPGSEQHQGRLEPGGRNGRHPFSGPLSPLGAASGSQRNEPGRQGGQRRLLPMILGMIGVIVIVGCLGVGAVVTINLLSLQSALNSPQSTLDNFYSALHVGDYQTAYRQLSSSYQQRLSEGSFRATFELAGTIESYQINDLQTQNDQASAKVKVRLVKPGGSTTVDEIKTVQLIVEDGEWKVNRVDPSLTRVYLGHWSAQADPGLGLRNLCNVLLS